MPGTGDGRASGTGSAAGTAEDAADTARRPGPASGSAPAIGRAAKRAGGVHTYRDHTPESGAATPIPHPRARVDSPRTTGPGSPPSGLPRTPPAGPATAAAAARRPEPGSEPPAHLLVIEDGPSDIELIKTLVAESGANVELHWARGVEQAVALLSAAPLAARRGMQRPGDRPPAAGFTCVLLDLAAPCCPGDRTTTEPDPTTAATTATAPGTGTAPHGPTGSQGHTGPEESDGLDGLRELLRRAPHTAVVVLTDAAGAELGAAAVAAGAQDFLIKHETDGPLLARALRYAVERKRADESQRRLVEAELRGQENARLQRHLLPTPLLDGAGLAFTRRYRPGRRRALLGGDFYDAVRTDDGTVHVVIGDVCGHGPDEAALGVALRIAWRTLVFAGLSGQALLTTLQHVLEHERRSDEIFATLCMLVLSPATPAEADPDRAGGPEPGDRARLYLAGHPAPLLLAGGRRPALLPAEHAGPALGLLPCDDCDSAWPGLELELEPGWRLLLYTDGLVEGRVGAGSRRLGQDGLIDLVADHQAAGLTRGRLVDSAIAEVEELNGGALTDDVAVLLLERNPIPLIMG
ncbi:fused response regulator/phosphatase [Kitasatospora sp. MBT63]|uniref:fused response regulator/phosphatase n=1 Tax=Kitasatospora sp. MBT63 TaxID=1444768 RepID=UPI00053A402D|nr:fused response regulator/phosphatase [Kitasatospora sp. MBT63]